MKNLLLILILFSGLIVRAQTDSVKDALPLVDGSAMDKEIFTFVEQVPEFPGGQEAMMKFISKNIVYPEHAKENNVEGKVLLKFVINTQGEIRNIEVINKVRYGYGLEEEAIRVLKKMPRWTPGKQNGKPVNVYFTLPISFRLK